MLHVWSNIPTRLTSPLARLLTRCACFDMVKYTCYHIPVGLYNIVIEHGVGTQRFCSNLCSGSNLVSLPLGRTTVLGLELGTRLRFVVWITDEIVPLSLPSIRLWLLFWPLPCAVAFTLCLASSFDANSATSFCSMSLHSFVSSADGAINFQFQNCSGFIAFQTEGKSQCFLKHWPDFSSQRCDEHWQCLLQLHVALDGRTMRPNVCASWNEGCLLSWSPTCCHQASWLAHQ